MTKPKTKTPSSKPGKAAAGRAPAPAEAGRKLAEAPQTDGAAKPAARSQELRLKVTADCKQRFRQAAKAAGVKKGVLLERLLAAWQERRPGLEGAPGPAHHAASAGLRAAAAAPGPQAKRSPRGA